MDYLKVDNRDVESEQPLDDSGEQGILEVSLVRMRGNPQLGRG